MLSKTNTDLVIKYYFNNVKLSGTNQGDGVFAKYSADITDFVKEQKILLGHLKNFKQYIGAIVPMKEQELKLYRQFAEFLEKYEEGQQKTNVSLGEKNHVKLVSADSQSNLKVKLENLSRDLSNPFIHIRNWIKGEMLNLGALIHAISEKEACDARK